jgi:hypothetical protein
MLEVVRTERQTHVVCRYAVPRDDLATLRRMRLDSDGIREMLDLLGGEVNASALVQLVEGSFTPWNSDGPPYGEATRYSDGTWPVCYTALEEETAREEIIYHRGRACFDRAENRRTAYYRLIKLDFDGLAADLRPFRHGWPGLVDPLDYGFCNRLGREALIRAIDAFLAPSARHAGGTNVPVFSRQVLRAPRELGRAAFTVDPETQRVTVELRSERQ